MMMMRKPATCIYKGWKSIDNVMIFFCSCLQINSRLYIEFGQVKCDNVIDLSI